MKIGFKLDQIIAVAVRNELRLQARIVPGLNADYIEVKLPQHLEGLLFLGQWELSGMGEIGYIPFSLGEGLVFNCTMSVINNSLVPVSGHG